MAAQHNTTFFGYHFRAAKLFDALFYKLPTTLVRFLRSNRAFMFISLSVGVGVGI